MNRLIGSSQVETTTEATTELVTYLGPNNVFDKPAPMHSMSFTAETDCKVVVNEGEEVFIPAGATLDIDDFKVKSFVIHGIGVKYMWLATI